MLETAKKKELKVRPQKMKPRLAQVIERPEFFDAGKLRSRKLSGRDDVASHSMHCVV